MQEQLLLSFNNLLYQTKSSWFSAADCTTGHYLYLSHTYIHIGFDSLRGCVFGSAKLVQTATLSLGWFLDRSQVPFAVIAL